MLSERRSFFDYIISSRMNCLDSQNHDRLKDQLSGRPPDPSPAGGTPNSARSGATHRRHSSCSGVACRSGAACHSAAQDFESVGQLQAEASSACGRGRARSYHEAGLDLGESNSASWSLIP